MLTFNQLRQRNLTRCMRWHTKGGVKAWDINRWAVACLGEAGEMCNAIKKLNRVEDELANRNEGDRQLDTREKAIAKIRQEIGDTAVYLDLLASRLDLKLEDCIREVFNAKSIEYGFPERLEDERKHEQQSGSGGNASGVAVSVAGGNSSMSAKGGYGGGGSVSPDGIKYSDVTVGGAAAVDPAIAEARKQPEFIYSADGVQLEEDRLKGFSYLEVKLGSTRYWILDRTQLNSDERENLPLLQMEMNNTEYHLSPLWYRPLYLWDEGGTKWSLQERYRHHWGRTP